MLYIRQAVKLLHGRVKLGDTKSESGVRDIPVPVFAQASALFLPVSGEGV